MGTKNIWESAICKVLCHESGSGGGLGGADLTPGTSSMHLHSPVLILLTVFGMQNNLAPSSSALSHGTATTSTGLKRVWSLGLGSYSSLQL